MMAEKNTVEFHKSQITRSFAQVDEALEMLETHCQSGMVLYSQNEQAKAAKQIQDGIRKTKASILNAKCHIR